MAMVGMGRTPMSRAVMRDHAVAVLQKEQHLGVPIVRARWPAVVEHYRLTVPQSL